MRNTESTDSDEDELKDRFARAVGSLAGGALTFQPPFDLATSAALSANIDEGDTADRLFDVTARRETAFRVQIHAIAPDVADRELINTVVDNMDLLVGLLEDLLDEIAPEEGDPSIG